MSTGDRKIYVHYFSAEDLDAQSDRKRDTPPSSSCFQLSDLENPSSKPKLFYTANDNFSTLALVLMDYLREASPMNSFYETRFSPVASNQIGKTGIKVLEGIVSMHNKIVLQTKK